MVPLYLTEQADVGPRAATLRLSLTPDAVAPRDWARPNVGRRAQCLADDPGSNRPIGTAFMLQRERSAAALGYDLIRALRIISYQ